VLVICGKRSQLGVRLREYTPQISLHLLGSWGASTVGNYRFKEYNRTISRGRAMMI
jgi:hypothetical protein